MTVHILASGSEGNCLLVSGGGVHLLVDAGISARRITAGLRELELSPCDVDGVLLTHEHSDHTAGLGTLTKHHRLPLYASGGTAEAGTRCVGGAAGHPAAGGVLHRRNAGDIVPHQPRRVGERGLSLRLRRRIDGRADGHGVRDGGGGGGSAGRGAAGAGEQPRRGVAAVGPVPVLSEAADTGAARPSVQRRGGLLCPVDGGGGHETVRAGTSE